MSDTERVHSDKVIAGDFGAEAALKSHLSGSGLPPEVSVTRDLLTEACGDNLVGVVLFGSRLLGTSPDPHSAADLFVVVDEYQRFYRDIGRRLPARRRAAIMAALNRFLPPNIISVRDPGDLRGAHYARASGRKRLRLRPNLRDPRSRTHVRRDQQPGKIRALPSRRRSPRHGRFPEELDPRALAGRRFGSSGPAAAGF